MGRFGISIIFSISVVFLVSSCAHYRLRTPTPEEKRNYVISKNLDRAILDPVELGPLNVIPALASGGDHPRSSFNQYYQYQKGLLEKDIIRVGYDDDTDEDFGMPPLSGEEKSHAVIIGVLIVGLVLVGATLPLLFWLDVI
jgi:hypothetical protein